MTQERRKHMLLYILMVLALSIVSIQFSFTAEYIDTLLIEENSVIETVQGKIPIIRTHL